MRNLKKFLALVLALMMVVSVMITVSAKEYTDVDDIDEDYADAVDVLTTINVLHGTSKDTFSPTSEITRAEMAAIVYRIMTGDVDDKNVDQLSGYDNDFTDVPKDAWYEPYVSYCNNSGWLLGDGKGHFMPKDPVDGHQVLAVLLRCLGYDQPGEFTGSDWRIKTAKIAKEQRITDGLEADIELAKPLERQQVAQLTYNTAVEAQRVRWTSAFGYTTYGIDGEKMGNLITVPDEAKVTFALDEWGAPKDGTNKATFNYPLTPVTKSYTVAAPKPVKEYWEAKDHCDVAKDLGLTENKDFTVYTNGKENSSTLTLKALSETDMVGAQGRYTAIYKIGSTYSIVYKDTLLAKVTDVKAATFDKNDHLKTDATLKLEVYDVKNGKTTATLKNGKDDWEYTKDQYLLVNYHQASKTSDKAVTDTKFTKDNNGDTKINWKDYYTFKGAPETFEGSQTLVSSNANKHTIDGTAYDDNNRYALDEAGKTMKVPFVWYKDTQGNVIGSTAKSPENGYGVINRIWAVNSDDDGSTTVKATVTYMNGDIGTINVGNVAYDDAARSRGTPIQNGAYLKIGKATYTDAAAGKAMTADGGVSKDGKFYVSDSFDTNKEADTEGIIAGHLFKIVPSTDVKGAYDFIEVVGKNNVYGGTEGQTPDMRGLGNTTTDIESGKTTNGDVKVDGNTVFLIRSTDPETQEYVYTTKTGYKNISDYKLGEVDYVNTDKDPAAEYVYIIANEKKAEGWHLFFAASTETDSNGKALVNVDDNGKTYTVYGYLDGEEGSVVIRKNQFGWVDADASTDADTWKTGAPIGDILGNQIKTNGNTLWMVYIKDGVVIDINGAQVQKSDSTIKNVNDNASGYANGVALDAQDMATGLSMINRYGEPYGTKGNKADEIEDYLGIYKDQFLMVRTVNTETKLDGETIELGGKVLSVDVDPVVGKWEDLANAGDTTADKSKIEYTVFVVYDDSFAITQAYIIDATKAASSGSGTTGSTAHTVTLVNGTKGTLMNITAAQMKQSVDDGKTVTFTFQAFNNNSSTNADTDLFVKGVAQFAVKLNNQTTEKVEVNVTVLTDNYATCTITITGVKDDQTVTLVPAGSSSIAETIANLGEDDSLTLPAGAGEVTLPAEIKGNVNANGNDMKGADSTGNTISGELTGVKTLKGKATIAKGATVEVEEIGAKAEITIEKGGKIKAEKIAKDAKIKVTANDETKAGDIMDVQTDDPTKVQGVVEVTTDASKKGVTGVIGAVVHTTAGTGDKVLTGDGKEGSAQVGKDDYVFSFKTAGATGANLYVVIKQDDTQVWKTDNTNTIPQSVYKDYKTMFIKFDPKNFGDNKNGVFTIQVVSADNEAGIATGTVIAAASFTIPEI